MSMCWLPQENVAYELVPASPAVSCMPTPSHSVCDMGGRGTYSCFLVGCCFHDLFRTARNILVQVPSSLFSRRFVRVQVVQSYSSTDITTAWKNCLFSLSVRSDFHMTDNLLVANHAFPIQVLTSLSVDEILLPRYVNFSTDLFFSECKMCQKEQKIAILF